MGYYYRPGKIVYPTGHYVYVYLDGDTPIYIGKGQKDRAWNHFRPGVRQSRPCTFYTKLDEMQAAGEEAIVRIIKEGLTNEEALNSEDDLIKLIGTRADGVGPLYNVFHRRPASCWGEYFPSLDDVIKDPRCMISDPTLRKRLRKGMTLTEAASAPASARRHRPIPVTCWGIDFPSIEHCSRDARCRVTGSALNDRLDRGMSPEEAAETPPAWSPPPVNRPPDWNLD
jgi:hypothetical protein